MDNVTIILKRIETGDPLAAEQLLPIVYDELRRLATRELSDEPAGQTLQPTALVHEAYLRLVDRPEEQQWNHRGHFFAAAAEAMRRILVESARRRRSLKRGGDRGRVPLESLAVADSGPHLDLLALDEALTRLEAERPDLARLVNLRYFAGLTLPQAAESLGIALRTAERQWTYARTWLRQALDDQSSGN